MSARFVTTQLFFFTDYFRLRLAALHFNENSKKQAKTRAGTDRCDIFSKVLGRRSHCLANKTYSKLTLKVANDAIINRLCPRFTGGSFRYSISK